MRDYWTFVVLAFAATGLVLGGLLWISLRAHRHRRRALGAAERDGAAEGNAGEAEA